MSSRQQQPIGRSKSLLDRLFNKNRSSLELVQRSSEITVDRDDDRSLTSSQANLDFQAEICTASYGNGKRASIRCKFENIISISVYYKN